ncbi:MAG TPA: indolepyruvate ferredoxin oxidoreductase subunit alpha [Burkholderiales bacterium]|nr:indolepyruvate ferredoxin oxidoreductase subunit alpha [Burkholderiales bacterium]
MERQFTKEIESLRLGDGATFHGEGILAVTKALLQSGVSYVGGYQGAPVSHLLDVMVQAKDYLDELGVHVEACTNEASAAAMLGASINYPARGAVTWKSIVGTNVAADALSYLASAGVMGGALIVLGEDYGEGGVVAQERSHAYAVKSLMWLLDPRPNLPKIAEMTEKGFELSEASNTPVMMELRIRACHVQGSFTTKGNKAPAVSTRLKLDGPPKEFIYDRLAHPPATFRQEKLKSEVRLPAARKFIAEHRLNEIFEGQEKTLGIVVQGGLYNNLILALKTLGLADAFGATRIPILALNVVYPLVPEEIVRFAAGKKALLVLEEGQPEFIEQEMATHLLRAGATAKLHGKDCMHMAGDYHVEALVRGLAKFLAQHAPQLDVSSGAAWLKKTSETKNKAAELLSALPARPPGFCVGCPERPVFSAMKLVAQDIGRPHVSMDVGCHCFGSFEPFSQGNTLLGYGMSLASAAGVTPMSSRRPVAIMGDGGFWHNGLLSGVASNLLNKGDGVLVIMKNGYASATGTQELLSSPPEDARMVAVGNSAANADRTIESTLTGLGVKWLRTVDNYKVGEVSKVYKEAMTSDYKGLKVIVAEGECQLERQRRLKPQVAQKLSKGERYVRVKYGVDEDTCTGDHSCIRLSGCPTLTVKDNPDPLRRDPVATVIDGCVGCGLCGENAHAAVLCPSFYRAEVIQNPSAWDKLKAKL